MADTWVNIQDTFSFISFRTHMIKAMLIASSVVYTVFRCNTRHMKTEIKRVGIGGQMELDELQYFYVLGEMTKF